MNKINKLLFPLLLVTAVISPVALFVLSIPRHLVPVENIHRPDFVLEQVKISEMIMGVKQWEMRAKVAEISRMGNYAQMSQLEGEVFRDELPFLNYVSDSARIFLDDNRLVMQTANIISKVSRSMTSLSAQQVVWQMNKGQFWGKGDIVFRRPDFHSTCESIYLDLPNNHLLMRGGVHTVVIGE